MNEMKAISNSRNNLYKVAIILLLAYAAFSSAMKDLNRLHEVAGEVHQLTSQGIDGVAKVYSATRSFAAGPELARGPMIEMSSDYPRNEIVEAGGSSEFRGLNHEWVESLSPAPKADRDPRVAVFREVSYLRSEIGKNEKRSTCETKKEKEKAIEKELHWNELAQASTRIAFLSELSKNGKLDIQALERSGRFRTIIRRLPGKKADAHWPSVNEFKTLNGVMGLRLAAADNNDQDADFSVNVSDESALPIMEKARRGVSEEDTDNAHKD